MQGAAFVLAGLGLYALLDANNKLLSIGYPAGELVLLRYGVLLAAVLLLRAVPRGAGRGALGGPLATHHAGLQGLRALAQIGAAFGFIAAFRHLPLASGYLVFFTSPFLVLALSVPLLAERVPPRAWGWCALGFAGVALAVLPRLLGGDAGAPMAYLAGFFATCCHALVIVLNRRLRDEAGLARLIFWPALLAVLVATPLAWRDWQPLPAADALRMAVNGLMSGGAVLCMAQGFRLAPAARLAPLEFMALPMSMVLDLAIWGRLPDGWMLGGGAVVVLAAWMSQRAVARAARLPAASAL